MSWIWAALMPHPPIIVPEVGEGREREAARTLDGVEALMKELVAAGRPDCILLLSPHQPYALGSFAINGEPILRGSFAPFGAPQVSFELRTPLVDADVLAGYLGRSGVPVSTTGSRDLTRDQGSTVPLYFLRKAYEDHGAHEKLPAVVLASPIGLDYTAANELGKTLASFDDGKRWGLLASGDLSHRLKPGAPAGYSQNGAVLDAAIVDALTVGDAFELLDLSPRTIEEAGECGLRSVLALLGFCGELGGAIRVLSYEGPFGVGYCNAVWRKEGGANG